MFGATQRSYMWPFYVQIAPNSLSEDCFCKYEFKIFETVLSFNKLIAKTSFSLGDKQATLYSGQRPTIVNDGE